MRGERIVHTLKTMAWCCIMSKYCVVSVMNSGTGCGPSACISFLCLLQPEMHLEPAVSFEHIYAFVHVMWEAVDNLHSSCTA